MHAASRFNAGFEASEYLAATLLDQAWHQVGPEALPDADGVPAFEAAALKRHGLALPAVPALALSPPMLQLGQARPRATSRSASRTVGVHWVMFCQLPAMHSKSLQPSTACAGPLSPRPRPRTRPKGAASLTRDGIAVLKCAFIANLSLV